MTLSKEYYEQEDVVQLAKDLLGKVLVTKIDGVLSSGIITETEAYAGVVDKASHAYNGRRTHRTEILYAGGGMSYVYLCYGIHYLFNIVTNKPDVPHAILVRAIQPLKGIPAILERRKAKALKKDLCVGPGKVSQALGITLAQNKLSLTGHTIWLEDDQIRVPESEIVIGPRIGVDYAAEDALLPYRFHVNGISKI